ncbi:MAG: phosphoribosylamine--glycine ligase [Planctomycetota bacterium]|jgi:phosphoribosylamine--glycine ligase|nr:phosphoribosylamine--glycine ligase [Planctomycetota bacterium]
MNVLVVGSGGREHTLAWKLSQSPKVDKVYIAPGNSGCAQAGECVDIDVDNFRLLVRWAREHDIGFVVPGAEAYYVAGIVDAFKGSGISTFGPDQAAAELEGSKIFAKNLMRRHGIPTADYAEFEQIEPALRYLDSRPEGPVVVKADGLCAGKGVIVCRNLGEAKDAVRRMMDGGEFGEAGRRVVIEELLRGQEVTILALTDGKTIAPLASSQDHKAAFDGDAGPNTGGMGAYSPAPVLTDELMDEVVGRILVPTVHAMNEEGRRFRGLLYAGLMLTAGGPKVLEYNVRFGDPETQPVLMRLESDLFDLLMATAQGKLVDREMKWTDDAAVCVVLASGGYPGPYEKGKVVSGLDKAAKHPDTVVFHAGAKLTPRGDVVTDGGRVFGVTALGSTIAEAIGRAYAAVGDVSFEGMRYRTDIGKKALVS